MEKENYNQLKEIVLARGISLFGVAKTNNLKQKVIGISHETLENFPPLVISLGFRLSNVVIEDIQNHPTQIYLHHYRQANYFLDKIALFVVDTIQRKGYRALAIPASQTIDWKHQRGHLSHKLVAEEAGVGWIGRNNLLITPQWGARIRLVSIITDFPLMVDKKLNKGCGDCQKCLEVCPAGAIKEKKEEFNHLTCFEQLKKFKKEYNIGHTICGICVKACYPISQKIQ